ncbi:zinc finger protein 423 isoform X1 [Macrobrachium rosenbergii]|uniref:zinc finger protein 423 isoform X1 n=2 Tax=Macrobrachium rosenbergii TaxID=79674 RepID=UPI0034D63420
MAGGSGLLLMKCDWGRTTDNGEEAAMLPSPLDPCHEVFEGGKSVFESLEVSVGGSSWEVGSDSRGSLSPASSATPTSASETDVEAAATVGVTQTTPYQCSFCDRAFPRLSYLKRHEQTHADQLPFRCEFCGRLFKHKRSRDRHVKLHTGDKKYKCCHCDAAFSRSDHLKIHMKTHDTQKPYQCSVCNRGYNTAAALTAHMQNHKAKLTAHALNQLLKDAQAPSDAHALSQILRDSTGDAHSQALNHLLKDSQKEQLLSPKSGDQGSGSSPGALTASPGGEQSPTLSPVATVRCPVCHAHCRNQAHLQRHVSRYHADDLQSSSLERPASRGGGSGASSIGGASSVASTPSPRPPSSLPSPRPLSNPLLSLVGGKLACLYCSRDGFPSLEALQLHLHSAHGSVINGEVRDMASMLGLPPSLGASLGAGGLASTLASPLGPGSSRGVSCELCGARVGGVTALQRHVVTAHTFTDLLARAAEGVFCAQCLLPFSNPGALAEHIKLVHAGPVLSAVLNKRPPSPPSDTPTDLSKKSRHDSLTSELPASTLLCSQCNAPFTNFEAFRRHLKTHLEGGDQITSSLSGSTQMMCPECRLPLTSDAPLEAHLATHLGVVTTEYGCQACLKLFPKPDELQKHLMDIHAHHLYRCALCKEMFDSKVSIQVHFAVKHSNECKVHKCTRCSLIFRSQSEFEVHIRASHMRREQSGGDSLLGGGSMGGSGGSYRCLLCTLSLGSEAELAAHVATHQRQFQCSLCDDAFHVEFLLDKHMQTQHNSELNGNVPQPENLAKPRRSPQKKDLKCDICDAEFSSDSGLLTHRKQAHNIKGSGSGVGAKVSAASLSLFCAYCSEACKSRGDLEAHMKTHQGSAGRHKCNICDELCPSAALLAQHKLTHVKVISGSACAVCREPLTSEQQFTSHQNDHHPSPLPQPCVVCRQTLVTDMEVNVHARFHAAQAAQAAAAASIASSTYGNSELLPPSNSYVTTTATGTSITTSSSNSSRASNSPRHSPSLKCPECHVKLESVEEAEAHAVAHHHHQGFGRTFGQSSRTYQCIKCQESFATEAEIEAHVASHLLHEGSVHECHLCQATFDTPLRLQCHLIEHTFEGCGSFTCYMCSSVFTTATRLQQHMVEHGLSARPYDCHHCHQRFFFRAELENHALSHPEAADGACRECLASFPDLPRRSLRRPSLSSLNTSQHFTTRATPPQGLSEGKPRASSPCSACAGDDSEQAPTNGHANSASESVDE